MIQTLCYPPPSPSPIDSMSRLTLGSSNNRVDERQSSCSSSTNIALPEEKAIRRKMVKRLQHRLDLQQQQQQSQTKLSTYKAARALEQLLHKSSHSLQEYQDVSTLNDRLRTILAIQLCKRTLKRKTHQAATPLSRKEALTRALGGPAQYEKAQALVHAIQAAKLTKAAELQACCGAWNTSGTCPYNNNKSMQKNNEFPRDAPFPSPVAKLFFHTPLVQAFQNAPMERIPTLNWSKMMAEAQQHLQAFQEYNNNSKNSK